MSGNELLDFLKKSHQALDLAMNKAIKMENPEEARTLLVKEFKVELMKKLFRPGGAKY